MKPGAGLDATVTSVRFGSLPDIQKSEKCRIADFGAEDASASVRFRPIADIKETPPRWAGWQRIKD